MKTLTCVKTRQPITLTKKLADSGEGSVWVTQQNDKLAKLYHQVTPERLEKLETMIVYPPSNPNLAANHITYAWPESLLRDEQGNLVGFLMPHIVGASELIQVYNPSQRKQLKLAIDWHYLHVVAYNLALAVHNLHEEGYVLGDIKAQNILVNSQGLVSIIDTDSFQVSHPLTGKLHYCLVGSPDYTPPELLGKDFSRTEQNRTHDRFRLGVIFYQLLFGGVHPFADGKWVGPGDPPELQDCLKRGLWPHGLDADLVTGRYTISLDVVHPLLKSCFLTCFNDGEWDPNWRPTAEQWKDAFGKAVKDLVVCSSIESHVYAKHHGKCYWCKRTTQIGTDIFAWAPGLKREANVSRSRNIAPPPSSRSQDVRQVTTPDPSNPIENPSRVAGLRSESYRVQTVINLDSYGRGGQQIDRSITRWVDDLGNGVLLYLVRIPAGTFTMGSPSSEEDRKSNEAQHPVYVPEFWMGQFTVTQAQYQRIMGQNPATRSDSNFVDPQKPIINVDWDNAIDFCQALSQRTGRSYDLPSEAQWEYACRACTTTPFHFGHTITPAYVNYDGNYPYANAPKGQYRSETTPVGSFPPNPWGLHDMHGNVWEWCADQYYEDYNQKPNSLKQDGSIPWAENSSGISPLSDELRILRGGSWYLIARDSRSGNRNWYRRDHADSNWGFRLILPAWAP